MAIRGYHLINNLVKKKKTTSTNLIKVKSKPPYTKNLRKEYILMDDTFPINKRTERTIKSVNHSSIRLKYSICIPFLPFLYFTRYFHTFTTPCWYIFSIYQKRIKFKSDVFTYESVIFISIFALIHCTSYKPFC